MPLVFVFVDVLLLLSSSIEFYGLATVYVYINQMNYVHFFTYATYFASLDNGDNAPTS